MKTLTFGILAASCVILSLGIGPVDARQVVDFKRNTCHSATLAAERAKGIPRHLLTAISLAETGRWNPQRREMFAWPWTVTAKGKGKYFPTKQAAIDEVKKLQAAGTKSIDVGCMQVNLYYHPRAFANLNEAFDPQTNAAYASRFLTGLHKETRSWAMAAGNYHSSNPVKNLPYRTKVLSLWEKVSGRKQNHLGKVPPVDPEKRGYRDPGSRATMLALLNSRFRARLSAERSAPRSAKSLQDLDAWRRGRLGPNYGAQNRAVRKAMQKRRRDQELTKKKISFRERRKSQLAAWRRDRTTNPFQH